MTMPRISRAQTDLPWENLPISEMPPGGWWVMKVMNQHERAVARALRNDGIGCYLPQVQVRRVYNGRKEVVTLPLFPMYLFLCGTPEARYEAKRHRSTLQVFDIPNQKKFLSELASIETAIAIDPNAKRYSGLVEGQKCRVICGPLMGAIGTLLSRDQVHDMTPSERVRAAKPDESKRTFVILIEMLGAGTATEIDPEYLEPV